MLLRTSVNKPGALLCCLISCSAISVGKLIVYIFYSSLQQKKREMVSSAFGEDEAGGRQTRLTVEDLNYLFMM